MPKRTDHASRRRTASVVKMPCRRSLAQRRQLVITLPEFVICAVEAKVAAINADAPETQATVDALIESELANLISVRDVVVLEQSFPGFTSAVTNWIEEATQ